jgi:hypothetical protein
MSEKTSKARKALTIALVSAGGLSALLGNVQFKSDEGVTFGKGVSIGLNHPHAIVTRMEKLRVDAVKVAEFNKNSRLTKRCFS